MPGLLEQQQGSQEVEKAKRECNGDEMGRVVHFVSPSKDFSFFSEAKNHQKILSRRVT